MEDLFHGNGLQSLCSLVGIDSSGGKKLLSKRIVEFVFRNSGDPPCTLSASHEVMNMKHCLANLPISKKRKNESPFSSSIAGRKSLRSSKCLKNMKSPSTYSFTSTSVIPLISESSFINFSNIVKEGKSTLLHIHVNHCTFVLANIASQCLQISVAIPN